MLASRCRGFAVTWPTLAATTASAVPGLGGMGRAGVEFSRAPAAVTPACRGTAGPAVIDMPCLCIDARFHDLRRLAKKRRL
jgi:hypothetical protein